MIESGTTTYADMYYFEEEIAPRHEAAGLRGVLGQTIIQFPVADAKTPAEGLARTETFVKEFAGDELITPAVAPHAMYTLDTDDAEGRRARSPIASTSRSSSISPRPKDEVKTVAREVQDRRRRGYPRVARLLGAADAGRARRLGDAGRHRRSWRAATSACRTTPRAT